MYRHKQFFLFNLLLLFFLSIHFGLKSQIEPYYWIQKIDILYEQVVYMIYFSEQIYSLEKLQVIQKNVHFLSHILNNLVAGHMEPLYYIFQEFWQETDTCLSDGGRRYIYIIYIHYTIYIIYVIYGITLLKLTRLTRETFLKSPTPDRNKISLTTRIIFPTSPSLTVGDKLHVLLLKVQNAYIYIYGPQV